MACACGGTCESCVSGGEPLSVARGTGRGQPKRRERVQATAQVGAGPVRESSQAPRGEQMDVRSRRAGDAESWCGTNQRGLDYEHLAAAPNLRPRQQIDRSWGEWLLPGVTIARPQPGTVVNLLPATIQALANTRRSLLRPGKDALRPREQGCGSLLRSRSRQRPTPVFEGERIEPQPPEYIRPMARDRTVFDGGEDREPRAREAEDGPIAPDTDDGVLVTTIPLGYRTVSFEVSDRWLADYLGDFAFMYDGDEITPTSHYGKVSSIRDALDTLWPQFRAARKGSHTAFHNRIGCYNLPREPSSVNARLRFEGVREPSWAAEDKPDLFWHLNWGPAHKVLMYAMQLIYTYPEYLDGDQIPEACSAVTSLCELGMRYFIEGQLAGIPIPNKNCRICNVVIHLRNKVDDESHLEQVDYVNEPCVNHSLDCAGGYKIEDGETVSGKPYWDYDLYWVNTHNCISGLSGTDRVCKLADVGASSNAFASLRTATITTHPLALHNRGAVCDYLLFLARLAHDSGVDSDLGVGAGFAANVAASRLARYSLGIIEAFGELLIHEFGHIYVAEGGHCENGTDLYACMSVAGAQWGCKVRASLGLPARTFSHYTAPDTDDDWNPSHHWHYYESGSTALSEPSYDGLELCDTVVEGKIGQTGVFCSTGCVIYLTESEYLDRFADFIACSGGLFTYAY